MNKKVYIIFLFVLLFRLFFAFQDAEFSNEDAYLTLRNVENIEETGKPLFEDNLSYGGRIAVFLPLYYYFLASINVIIGNVSFKLIPALLFSSLVFLVYLITKELTKDEDSALLATLTSAFIPVLISNTTNNISIFSAALFIILLMILSLMKIENKKSLSLFMGLSLLFPLVHNMAFLFIISLIVYFILSIAESNKISKIKKEAILFSIFVTLIIGFLFFKDAILLHGFNIIFQNTPLKILSSYFKGINIVELIISLGIIPLLFGILGLSYAIRKKNDNMLFLTSILATTSLLLIFKLINFSLAIIFLGILLAIISSIGFEKSFKYVKLTKFSDYLKYIKFSFLILIFLLLIIPSYIGANDSKNKVLNNEELNALFWLRDETEEDSTILSSHEEGHFITNIAKRKNVIDDNFLLIENIDQRYNDVERIYTTESQVKALQALNKYNVRYVYFSDRTKQIYNVDEIAYVDDNCFKEVYHTEEARIYKVRC